MSVRDEGQGRVATVILDPADGPGGRGREALGTANRVGPVRQAAGTGRHRAPVA
jgi:hypothetical protein